VGIDISARVEAQEKIRQTSEQLRQLTAHLQEVREEERASMAREIHDELGQQLTGLKMDVYWLKEGLGPSDTVMIQQVEGILKAARSNDRYRAENIGGLRPFVLDDLGLIEALKSHSREFQSRFGIEVEFKLICRTCIFLPKWASACSGYSRNRLPMWRDTRRPTKVSCYITRSGNKII